MTAESFNNNNFLANFYQWKSLGLFVIYAQKLRSGFLAPPFGGFWGNLYASSTPRWKAHAPLPVKNYEPKYLIFGALSRRWVNLTLKIGLKSCLPPTSMDHRGMVILYNFVAKRFHTKKLYGRLYSIDIKFYSQKTTNSRFWVTLLEI